MGAGGASSRKRKSATLESTDEAPALTTIAAPDSPSPRVSEDEGVGEEGGSDDHLSNLSDDILGKIISLLTTKEGARTRILASRWRDLWLSAPLNLDCRDLTAVGWKSVRSTGVRKNVCSAAVSRILSSHHGPGRRLYIDVYNFNISAITVEACLRSAALDNLEELDFINHWLEQPHQALVFRFWRTLRVANIGRCNLSDVSFQGLHFPMLKQLGLVRVTISECSLHGLIAGCPALECLLIYHNYGARRIRISSLTIRSIGVLSDEIRTCGCGGPELLEQLVIENAPCLLRLLLLDPQDRLHVSVVAVPKLETLGFIGDTCHLGEFSTLVFGSTVIQGLCIDKLITEVHTVKTLALDMRNLCLDTIIELMRCFPCLEKLYIQSYEAKPGNMWRRKYRNLIGCSFMRLKTIVLTEYRGLKAQVNFLTFFVLNANLLESVTLGIKARNKNEEFLAEQRMKLQIENGASKDVRLHFTSDTCVRSFYMVMDVRDYDLTDPFAHI